MKELSKDKWESIYNSVFRVFPPNESLDMDIYYTTPRGNQQHFKTTDEFLSFLCVAIGENIQGDKIRYVLRDNEEYSKAKMFVNEVVERIKKRG